MLNKGEIRGQRDEGSLRDVVTRMMFFAGLNQRLS